MHRVEVLDCPMDIATMDETVDVIARRIDQGHFTQHVVVNVAKVVNMKKDPDLDRAVRSCDIINIDGMGVVIGARLLGFQVPERIAGIDLFHRLVRMSESSHFPVFLLGAREYVITDTRNKLQRIYPNLIIAGFHHGYFWDNEESVVNLIRSSGARLLFVAITSPKKEHFINKWKNELGVDFAMGVGGTFDVISGRIRRAPVWMQKCGLEWLYRVIQEPRRMWKRYLFTNSEFAWMLLKARLGFQRN